MPILNICVPSDKIFQAIRTVLLDTTLTYSARAIYGWLLVCPEDTFVGPDEIALAGGITKGKAYRAMAELKKAGLLVLGRRRNKRGAVIQMEYRILMPRAYNLPY